MSCTVGLLLVAGIAQSQILSAPVVSRVVPVGSGIYEAVVGESVDELYVASTGEAARHVVVLDPKTLATRRTIATGPATAFGLAFNNRTKTLYTSNTTAGSVSAIDVRTGRLLATITAPDGSYAHVFRLLVDEASNTIFVSLPETSSRIWVIDGRSNTLREVITNVGGRSTGLALDRANGRLYTCSIASSEIIEIDLESRRVLRRFPSGGLGTTHLAFDSANRRLFAGHQQSGDVTILDLDTAKVVKTITTGAGALGLAFDAARTILYVANRRADTVSVIDTSRLLLVKTLQTRSLPNTVVVDSRTGDAYVTLKARAGTADSVAHIRGPSVLR